MPEVKPEISVIVATYNQEDTIARTLDSILSQELSVPFEVIIGDDASSDGTSGICEEYARKYPGIVRHIRREKNLGVVGNYYDCISRSRGRFLADCAGDDFWTDPKKLAKEYALISGDETVTMVVTDWLCCDEDGGNVRRFPGLKPPDGIEYFSSSSIGELLAQKLTLHLCTALYRKDVIDRAVKKDPYLFCNPENRCEDLQIILEMLDKGRVALLPDVTLHYSIGQDSISHRVDYGKRFAHSLEMLKFARKLQKHYAIPDSMMETRYKAGTDYLAALAFQTGDSTFGDRLNAFIKESGTQPRFRARVYLTIMSHPALWRITRKLHKGKRF